MVVVPTRRDEIFQLLADGRADVAAGSLTVTEERARLVDFSQPFATEVNEVVITGPERSEEHTSELQSLMRISYAVFCLKKKNQKTRKTWTETKITETI